MDKSVRVLTENPLNAETPLAAMQSWITSNELFFKRNQEQIRSAPVALADWQLTIEGLVENRKILHFGDILALPRVEIANTLECSGNGRSLLTKEASGNPWVIGAVGNAMWGGVRLSDILELAGVSSKAAHVAFEGMDNPESPATVKFIRSIPLAKAMDSTILAYEMNGEPLPLAHGFPMRVLALGWTGANCIKWLSKITLLAEPYKGFFMDSVYRIFQKGEEPSTGQVVTTIPLKSLITWPENKAELPFGKVPIRGAAYGGEEEIVQVDISVDGGSTWHKATFVGPHQAYAWQRWEYTWQTTKLGNHTLLSRATDASGQVQPMNANWNVLGYGNNGILEHGVTVTVTKGP